MSLVLSEQVRVSNREELASWEVRRSPNTQRGGITRRKPLGSFSLITSKQYSIIPVVCRSFIVQWVI